MGLRAGSEDHLSLTKLVRPARFEREPWEVNVQEGGAVGGEKEDGGEANERPAGEKVEVFSQEEHVPDHCSPAKT